ncbi:DUF2771 domain-containing protein [Nocardia otitidiscaviarum]|uniref:DUF2771 domain-containing protein n=1 Tax=Nocardia otitidiscaviarum TaxID=1823 RepID=A0A516NSV8_9NOCA|nr:DUF2771 domain-containing protein [Nocardia otitidiscaviarum]MCP9621234.1 DUF2771 domain-containing protein [Nocardia otitidiscaviarum]QDP81971.1 DUF2771 domain-containing protein [Nocardia otitidiscaviarum]
MSKPNARTILALVAAALLVFVAAVATVVALAVRNADEPKPAITAYAHGRTVTVEPFMYCSVQMADCLVLPKDGETQLPVALDCPADSDCRTGEFADLEVPGGYPLQLSLPQSIARSPWVAVAYYELPDGAIMPQRISHRDFDEGTVAITIPSAERLPLLGVEVQLPILARDTTTGEEGYIPHAAWSIRTAD